MTRFARAKGSKASNERVPEEATSWTDMKQQLLEKNKRVDDGKKKQEVDAQKVKNYKDFLQNTEEEESKKTKWAEFPTEKPKKVQENNNNEASVEKKVKKKKALKVMKDKDKGVKRKSEENENGEEPVEKKQKTENDSQDQQNVETKKQIKKKQKKIKKNNQTPNKKENKPKKPVDLSTLSEEERKKIEKKKEKKMRQVEKRKQFKSQTKNRRKNPIEKISVNGKEIELVYVDGFPVKKEDADRLAQLRKEMISRGLPRSEIKIAMKLERRKAEKALAREKKKVCFNCRKSGHNLSECPDIGNQVAETTGTGICFKCGSTEHTHFECKVIKGQEFKYAQCFICHEQGHIARQCPDNARGLYPKGGACRVCGDVTHLKKDCPTYQAQQQQSEQGVHVETLTDGDNPDSLGRNEDSMKMKEQKRVNKVIKFT